MTEEELDQMNIAETDVAAVIDLIRGEAQGVNPRAYYRAELELIGRLREKYGRDAANWFLGYIWTTVAKLRKQDARHGD